MQNISTQSLLWSYPQDHSLEYFSLSEQQDYYLFTGTVVCLLEGEPTRISYQLRCNWAWETRSVFIQQAQGERQQEITIAVDQRQRWTLNGEPVAFADGLFDIDLGVTPATNTLPIRRLSLKPSESQETTAVWVRFPGLTLEPLHQQYTCLNHREYVYESFRSGFRADLKVDGDGVVIRYGDLWQRLPRP
ncbi:MAG: putative glycolipid-binding domain-containing protein [Chloroflexota bacterium]